MSPPIQKPGKSRQDYETPFAFINAVTRRFGSLGFDLAASAENSKSSAGKYFDVADDALTQSWQDLTKGWCWLNPPFDNIGPWVRKCAEESRKTAILCLLPASVGSQWFANWVFGCARVYFLSPRLSFDGIAPYPKDLILVEYSPKVPVGFECWRWR